MVHSIKKTYISENDWKKIVGEKFDVFWFKENHNW